VATETLTIASGSPWSTPGGATNLIIECFGAGGGGGPSDSTKSGNAGGGGGGGAYSKLVIASPSGDYTFFVGAGGTSAVAGGASWFKSNDLNGCVAKGGGPGVNDGSAGIGGAAADGFGSTKWSGGNGAPQQGSSPQLVGGGGGEGAGAAANGTTATNGTGASGVADGGDGGAGGLAHVNGDAPASGNGGGGGGGGHTNTGGSPTSGGTGADGKIVLTWTTAGFNTKVMVNGVWKEVPSASVMVDGAWKAVSSMKVMVNGAWKTV